ncbi:MAG: DUF4375 domain-containing protein, partial [Bacteroidota bacterium]|nr:DUF4375 domain-containing protein [Bacteroidota bacterium]
EALDLIGATHNYQLLLNAVETLFKHNESTENLNKRISSKTLHKIIDVSEFYGNSELQNALNKLDQEFFKYKENLSKLKMEYFEKNKEQLWSELKENIRE